MEGWIEAAAFVARLIEFASLAMLRRKYGAEVYL